MPCPQCQKQLPNTLNFCPYCGEPLTMPISLPAWWAAFRATMLPVVLGTVTMVVFGLGLVIWWGSQIMYQNYVEATPTPSIALVLPSETPTTRSLNLVDYWGGTLQAVTVQGDYLLQAIGAKLVVSYKESPHEPIGTLLLSHPIHLLAAQDSELYLVTTDNMFQRVAFDTPTQPRLLSQQHLPRLPQKMVVVNQHVYLLSHDGLMIITPHDDNATGRIDPTLTPPREMIVVDSVGYALTSLDGLSSDSLQLWDMSNPSYPTEISRYNDLIEVDALAVGSDHIYLADRNKGIRVLEKSPLREVGLDSFAGQVQWLKLSEQQLYGIYHTFDEVYYLRIINLADPSHPMPVGADYRLAGTVTKVAQFDRRLYVAYTQGWQILNLDNLAQPYEITPYWLSQPSDLAVANRYAYVVDNQRGLQTINLKTGQLMGAYNPPNKAQNLITTDNYAYLSSGTTLQVVDITNPVELKPLGVTTLRHDPWRMVITHELLYAATGPSGLQIINVANPRDPKWVAEYGDITEVGDVAVVGEHAYVAAGKAGLQILAVKDAAYPMQVGQFSQWGGVNQVAAWSHYLAVTGGSRLTWLDITDSYSPTLLGTVDFNDPLGPIVDLVPQADRLYIAAYNGLGVVDLANLQLVAFYHTPTPPVALAVNSPDLYLLLSSQGGVMVLR